MREEKEAERENRGRVENEVAIVFLLVPFLVVLEVVVLALTLSLESLSLIVATLVTPFIPLWWGVRKLVRKKLQYLDCNLYGPISRMLTSVEDNGKRILHVGDLEKLMDLQRDLAVGGSYWGFDVRPCHFVNELGDFSERGKNLDYKLAKLREIFAKHNEVLDSKWRTSLALDAVGIEPLRQSSGRIQDFRKVGPVVMESCPQLIKEIDVLTSRLSRDRRYLLHKLNEFLKDHELQVWKPEMPRSRYTVWQ